jgi:hypothetical protein
MSWHAPPMNGYFDTTGLRSSDDQEVYFDGLLGFLRDQDA